MATATEKTEIVCIKRSGLSFVHTEDCDLAAKVTMLRYTPGEVYDPRKGIVQELFVPRFPG